MPRIGLVFVACLFLFGCSRPSDRYIYPNTKVARDSAFFWRDNNHILFVGPSPQTVSDTDSVGPSEDYAIIELDTRNGALREHARVDRDVPFCYSEGVINYKRAGRVYHGNLGAEKEDVESPKREAAGAKFSRLRCTTPVLPLLPQHPEFVQPLLERHGFLELRFAAGGPRSSCEHECEIFIWRPEFAAPTRVQTYTLWNARNILGEWAYPLHFYPFKGAYFIWGDSTRKPGVRGHWIGWWLYPDGRTEYVQIPEGNWHRFSRVNHGYQPWRDGILIGVGHPDNRTYYFRRLASGYSQAKVIYHGEAWRAVVSPDGCRLVVPEKKSNATFAHIQIIRLCTNP